MQPLILLKEKRPEILDAERYEETMQIAMERICGKAEDGDIEAIKQLREISEEMRFRNMILNSDDDEYSC